MPTFWGSSSVGWYNSLAKKHSFIVPLTNDGIHNVVVYCLSNPVHTVIQAIGLKLNEEKIASP